MDRPILFWLALLTAAGVAVMAAQLALGTRRLRRLEHVPPLPPDALPPTSVVIAARNEARAIEHALRSVLALEGDAVEVIVVDDRSDDETGAILDRMAAGEPRLRVLHVAELPAGWLGKNHALWMGAREAGGELLLFTDADVVMAPDTLLRAAAYLESERLDHVTIAPRVTMPGFLLPLFGAVFSIFFLLFSRPWRVRDPRTAQHIGIGAFNLLRADVYRRLGTHRAIAMRPDDDMKLGKLVKKNGFAQELLVAPERVSVEWYSSVREMVRGLRKNGFAGVDYRLSMIVLATVTHSLFLIWPFLAVFLTAGPVRVMYGVAVVLLLGLYAGSAREQGTPWWYGVGFPIASALFLFVIWNATIYALRNRGIEWRGTHYPLDELRANRV